MELQFYRTGKPKPYLQQGDILREIAVVRLTRELTILAATEADAPDEPRPGLTVRLVRPDDIEGAFERGHELVAVSAFMTNAMIISQTCDVEHREYVAVCPVFPMTTISVEERANAVRAGRVHHRFYVPPTEGLVESFVELNIVNSAAKDHLPMEKRIASLSDTGRDLLLAKIARFYCRPAED